LSKLYKEIQANKEKERGRQQGNQIRLISLLFSQVICSKAIPNFMLSLWDNLLPWFSKEMKNDLLKNN